MTRALVLLLAVVLGACGNLFKTERPASTTYALSVPQAPAMSPQLPAVLLVHRPTAAPGLESDRVVVAFPDGRTEAYSGVRFSAPVPAVVQSTLTESLRVFTQSDRVRYDALYGQDQWTMGKLTLQGALRFDHAWSYSPPQTIGPALINGQALLATPLSFSRVDGVNYKDISPRVGAAKDSSLAGAVLGGRVKPAHGEVTLRAIAPRRPGSRVASGAKARASPTAIFTSAGRAMTNAIAARGRLSRHGRR